MRSWRAVLFMAAFSCGLLHAQENRTDLTSISEIRALTLNEASEGKQVLVEGVITYVDGRDYPGLFIEDSGSGIYVETTEGSQPKPGEQVRLVAQVGAGHFAPLLKAVRFSVLSSGTLLPAKAVTFEGLTSGAYDSVRVQIEGVVRSVAAASYGRIYLDVMMGNDRVRTLISAARVGEAMPLIGSVVKLSGVCYARFNKKRQLVACWLGVNNLSDVQAIENAPVVIEEMTINRLLQYRPSQVTLPCVRLRGVVTHQEPGRWLFIRDEGQGLLVKTQQDGSLEPGDVVEVLGFPALGQYEPFVEDGMFEKVGRSDLPSPTPVTHEQLLSGEFDADLISIEVRVIDRMRRGSEQTLVLEAGSFLFNAHLQNGVDLRDIAPNGSRSLLKGICMVQPLEHWRPRQNARPESFRIVLRSANDITLLQRPSWFTLTRLLWTLGLVTASGLGAALWAMALRRKVAAQTEIITEKLQREAVLEERSRLARELHDTVEQELVGITMQLDAAAARFEDQPATAQRFLDLARSMSRRSFSELRRSVWDLRSHFLESGDLASALNAAVIPMADGAGLKVEVNVTGTPVRLSGRIEKNLLRIGQEAVSNAIKHAEATQLIVSIAFEERLVRLTVRDNGKGFVPHPETSPGHFGLLDIERAEKINAQLTIISHEGSGASICVEARITEEVRP